MVKDIKLEIKIRNKDGSVGLHRIEELWDEQWEDAMDCYKLWWKEIQDSLASSDQTTLPKEKEITQPKDEN